MIGKKIKGEHIEEYSKEDPNLFPFKLTFTHLATYHHSLEQ